jgi:hypothetical protein
MVARHCAQWICVGYQIDLLAKSNKAMGPDETDVNRSGTRPPVVA